MPLVLGLPGIDQQQKKWSWILEFLDTAPGDEEGSYQSDVEGAHSNAFAIESGAYFDISIR